LPTERPNPPEPSDPTDSSALPDSKFKGFEAFLNIENENDIQVPNSNLITTKSIHIFLICSFVFLIHCVRDLKQILRNPLVIRHDNVQVTRRQRTFIPKRMVNVIKC